MTATAMPGIRYSCISGRMTLSITREISACLTLLSPYVLEAIKPENIKVENKRLLKIPQCMHSPWANSMNKYRLLRNTHVKRFPRRGHPGCDDCRACGPGLGDMNGVSRDLEAPSRADDFHRPTLYLQDYLSPHDVADLGSGRQVAGFFGVGRELGHSHAHFAIRPAHIDSFQYLRLLCRGYRNGGHGRLHHNQGAENRGDRKA